MPRYALLVLAVVVAAAMGEALLPTRGRTVSTFGSVTAPGGYAGPAYSSTLFGAPLAEGNQWDINTVYWNGVGVARGVLVDFGPLQCTISEIVLQADCNDNSYVDYFANGVWTPLQFGTCIGSGDGPATCTSVGSGMRTKTRTVSLTGVSKLRTYCSTGDYLCSVSRLTATGTCRGTGIFPTYAESITKTGSVAAASGFLAPTLPSAAKLFHDFLAEGSTWNIESMFWTGTGVSNAVYVDLLGTCAINEVIAEVDNNDDNVLEYYAGGSWHAIDLGYCDAPRPGICATYSHGLRTITLPVSITGATRLRVYCAAGDTNCAISRLFASGSCVLPTLDPAVTAYCDGIAASCTSLGAECTTLHSLDHVFKGALLGSGNMDPQVAGLNGVGSQTGGITLTGNTVVVTASGTAYCTGFSCPTSPAGVIGSTANSNFLLSGVPTHSLIARVGAGPWFFVGNGPKTITGAGALTFAYNDDNNNYSDNNGSWSINVYAGITSTVPNDCDAAATACNAVHADCLDKVAHCPLV